MRRGMLKYLAVVSGVAVVLLAAPPPAAAAGNAGVHVHKTVDPLQLAVTPNIGVTLGVDKAVAIPGDVLTYTAVVSNPTSTFAMGGYIDAQANADTTATVVYYWDQLEICGTGCGDGIAMNNPNWTAVAAFEAAQPSYQPVEPPALHAGLTLAAQGVARSGVIYPPSGDAILGTVISPAATATWTYVAHVVLNPTQLAQLADPTRAAGIRNVIHFEVTSRSSTAAQPYTDPEPFTNPLLPGPNPGAVTNASVTFTMPDGSQTTVGPGAVPALALIPAGGTASATAQYRLPAPAPRGATESEADYASRLAAVDGATLTATAVAAGTGFSGPVYATSAPVTTTETIPILTIAKSGPAQVNAGDAETNPLALQNVGGATADGISITDTVPAGAGTVSGAPATLASGASVTATATYGVPANQVEGALTDVASITWKDANGNPYGSFTSSFTTQVHNSLFGAQLTLAPATAGPNPPGTAQTLTATLLDRNGNPIANQLVTFAITGANAGTGTATTDAAGKATFTYTGANPGNDVAKATATAGGLTVSSNTATISWGKLLQPVVTSPVQGNFFPNPNSDCTFGAGPNSTPVFQQTFPDVLFNADASFVPHDISTVGSGTRPFTDLTVDVNGNYNGQVVAEGNGQQAGTNSLYSFYAEFSGSFVVAQAGDLTFTVVHDDGYLLGVGGGATRVSGDYEGNPPATTPFSGYPTVAAFDQGGAATGSATIHFPAAGTFPYELDYTECGGGGLRLILETAQFVPQTDPLSIYVGYADGLRPGGSIFPFPWQGSPNVTFIGGCTFDAGAIRFDNSGTTDITLDKVTVDLGSFAGAPHFDLWPASLVVPAGGILILTQTGCFNFDSSDFSSAGCGGNNGVLPLVNVVRNGVTATYTDTHQVLNTHGFDMACQGNESISWQRIAGQASTINLPLPPAAMLDLMPFNVPGAIQGQSLAFTVSALDGAGNPVPSLPVSLQVFGANAQTLSATTGLNGLATFTYAGSLPGSDTLQASAFILGLRAISNQGSVVWTSPGGGGGGLGPSITDPSPSDGAIVTKPISVDAVIAPPGGHSITGWRVFYQAVAGGPQVAIGGGTGAPPSPLGVTFDPTLLANGAYTLTVEATADNGVVQQVSSGVSVFGALKLGRYTTTFQDMSLPVTGFQLGVRRTYDTLNAGVSGDFGNGWNVSLTDFKTSSNRVLGAGGWSQYNQSCVLGLCLTGFKNAGPRYVTITWPDGHADVFDFTPQGGTNIFWSCSPSFSARASTGTTGTLIPLDDTSCSYTGDGNLYGSNGLYNPQRFQLTTRDGQVLVLDRAGGLISMTDPNGNRLTVDGTGLHASNGQSIVFVRDGAGRITRITGPAAGQVVSYTYTTGGDLATSVDPLGDVDTYVYDSSHHLLKVTGPQGSIGSTAYDSSGRLTSITDAAGHTIQIQTDVGSQTETLVDPIGATTTVSTADDLGDIVRQDVISGGQKISTSFSYDSAGRVIQKTDALGNVTKSQYDANGDLTQVTDGNGNTTRFTYDSSGHGTSIVAPDGTVVAAASYAADGNLTSLTQGGTVTHFVYDGAGRLSSRTDAMGDTVSYTYDSLGNVNAVSDPGGMSMTYVYDAANRPIAIKYPLGGTVQVKYDAAGNMTGIVDPLGGTDTFGYDAAGNLTSATDPLGASSSVTYDADNRVTSVKDRLGQTTAYTRDADGRLTRIDYPDGQFLAFTYDGFGRPITIANSGSKIDNAYDAVGEVTSTTTTAPSIGSATITYTYDAAGNRLSATAPDGRVSYGYDSDGRLVSVTDPKGGIFDFGYDSASRVTALTRPNGIADAYSYDSNGRLTAIASTLGASSIQDLSRTFDVNGQVASTTNATGTTAYQHDANGRLIGVTGPGSASATYTYDAAGNRLSSPGSAAGAYNAADELTSDSNFTYTYDAQGQRTSKRDRLTGATTTYTYNGLGQLDAVQYPDGTSATFAYDPLGRRIGVTTGGGTTGFVYDGTNARLEYSGGALTASYVTTSAVDRPLEMSRGGSSYYYLQDFQGSVTGLTTATGAIAASYSYDAFGAPTSAAPSLPNPFTYTGREFDAKSGLYYNRDRYYEPATGSFLTQDPVYTGQPYAYAAGDPIDFSDPTGAGPTIDLGEIWTFIDTKILPQIRTVGCALAAAGGLAEVILNAVTDVGVTAESVGAIAISVGVACRFANLASKAGASSWMTLLFLPLLAAVVAAVVDMAFQAECIIRKGGSFSWQHAAWTAAAAAVIGIGSAVLGIPIPDGGGAKALAAAASVTLLAAGLSGWSDELNSGGPC